MLSLLPTNRADLQSAIENGRSLSFGRATVSPSSNLPPCMKGLAGDLVVVGLLQMLADAKAQAARDSATIDDLRQRLHECAERGVRLANRLIEKELGE